MAARFGTYVQFQSSDRAAPADAKQLASVAPGEPVEVSIYLKPRPGGALPAQREELYRDDVRLVTDFAAAHGLTIVTAEPARRLVQLSGPASRMQQAFRTSLYQYADAGRQFRGRSGALQLPQELADVVESVLGLDTRPVARPRLVARPATATEAGHPPNQFAALYDFPSGLNGSGQTIALIELGGGFSAADTQAAFAAMKLTPPRVVAVSVDHARNDPAGSGADGEVALDIQVAGGVAPGVEIAVYFAPNTDAGFADAISAATHDATYAPSVISISWGSVEASWTEQAVRTMNSLLQDAAALGISVFAAAGDGLATDGIADGHAHVDFPASSPWAIGCGGTATTISAGAITAQRVWNDGTSGTGGGISDLFDPPAFQAGVALPPSLNGGRKGRGVPDVAGNAAPESGYAIIAGGQAQIAAGTSAVAPLWAGLVARINQKAGRRIGFFLPADLRAAAIADRRHRRARTGRPARASATKPARAGAPARGSAPRAARRCAMRWPAARRRAEGGRPMATHPPAHGAPLDPAKRPVRAAAKDRPFFDPVAYGNGPHDSVTDTTENAAVTEHEIGWMARASATRRARATW